MTLHKLKQWFEGGYENISDEIENNQQVIADDWNDFITSLFDIGDLTEHELGKYLNQY